MANNHAAQFKRSSPLISAEFISPPCSLLRSQSVISTARPDRTQRCGPGLTVPSCHQPSRAAGSVPLAARLFSLRLFSLRLSTSLTGIYQIDSTLGNTSSSHSHIILEHLWSVFCHLYVLHLYLSAPQSHPSLGLSAGHWRHSLDRSAHAVLRDWNMSRSSSQHSAPRGGQQQKQRKLNWEGCEATLGWHRLPPQEFELEMEAVL